MKFEVDTDLLSTAVNKLNTTLQEISINREEMYSAVEELEATWRGPAHDEYRAQFQTDSEEMTALTREIQEVIDRIGEARKGYANCEAGVGDLIQKISI